MSNANRALLIAVALTAAVFGYLNTRAPDEPAAITDERVGTNAPSFDLPVLDQDDRVALSDLAGEVVVLDFWATHCAPCRRSMPHVERLGRRYAEDGVRVLSINVDFPDDDRVAQVQGFVRAQQLDSTVLMDNGNTAYLYGASRIPLLVMIDREGIIQRVFQGYTEYNELADGLESLL